MCGIVGYCGEEPALPKLIQGLKNLEYRGYDSWGIYCDGTLHRSLKNIEESETLFLHDIKATSGIGHTRWATHGSVSIKNSHPQYHEGVYVVHNGTIPGLGHLKKRYSNIHFESETDTELIAIEISRQIKNGLNFLDAVRGAVYILQSYGPIGAILVMSDSHPNEIIAYSNESSLSFSGHYIASDVYTLREMGSQNHQAYRLHNDTYVRFLNHNSPEVHGKIKTESIPRSNIVPVNEDNMLSEIKEQSLLVEQIPINSHKPDITNENIFIGCGSSYYAGMYGATYLNSQGFCSHYYYASEFNLPIQNDTNYIFISQSGETKDTIKSVNCDMKNIWSITNSYGNTLSSFNNIKNIKINAGPEKGVAATKTFTMTALNILGWYKKDIKNACCDLSICLESLCKNIIPLQQLAHEFVKYNNILFLGTELYYPIALESALKVKEVAYIHAEAMPSTEIKHGPIALIDDNTLSVFLHDSWSFQKVQDNKQQIKSRNGKVICISNTSDSHFVLPTVGDRVLQPILTMAAIQLISYYASRIKGFDPNKPKNLAKTVTV